MIEQQEPCYEQHDINHDDRKAISASPNRRTSRKCIEFRSVRIIQTSQHVINRTNLLQQLPNALIPSGQLYQQTIRRIIHICLHGRRNAGCLMQELERVQHLEKIQRHFPDHRQTGVCHINH